MASVVLVNNVIENGLRVMTLSYQNRTYLVMLRNINGWSIDGYRCGNRTGKYKIPKVIHNAVRSIVDNEEKEYWRRFYISDAVEKWSKGLKNYIVIALVKQGICTLEILKDCINKKLLVLDGGDVKFQGNKLHGIGKKAFSLIEDVVIKTEKT